MSIWLIIDILVVLYWIGVATLIISEDREPTASLAWLLVLFALPFVGLVVYFFLGRNWPAITQRSRARHRLIALVSAFMPQVRAPHEASTSAFRAAPPTDAVGRTSELITHVAAAPPMPVRSCEIFEDGAEYFDVLIADIAGAQRFVHMSYFIWGHDELTARITAALLDRLQAGVEVRILNDFIGCFPYSSAEMTRLREAGAHIGSDMKGLARLNYRNHRKITVIDGDLGHTGGFNIGQEYIDGGSRFPAWRDTGLRLTGPGVADLEKLFDMRWYEVFGEDLFRPEYYPDPDAPGGEIMVQTVHHGHDDPWHSATRAHQVAISGASERVLLQSPYFVPDPSTMDVLVNAAASGVRVDLMTTTYLDKRIPWYAAETYFRRFLQAGGRIWMWEKGFFHTKSLTVDGIACSIGTLNLDMRSLRLHKELMVWIYDEQIVAHHERIFERDREACRELTLAEVEGWGWPRRFRNSAARLVSNLL
ncbi:cardiolipin synthase [Brachybacterium hainanense]|uniref:Cardiolipin synthase n=1 Tax=Brachybacterium hainanense TaxID=1541174 RepID=A0ABV6RBM8_9MICO